MNQNVEEKVDKEERNEEHEESNAEKDVAEEKPNDEHAEEEVRNESEEEARNESEVKEEQYYELAEEESYEEREESKDNIEEERKEEGELYYELEDGEGRWMLVVRARRSGRESKAITKKAVKKKMRGNNVRSVRVQSHNGRVSEVSCENCTHTAVAAKKKGCYTQRDSGRVWTTPEMSGQGSHHWDSKGMYEGEILS